MTGPTVRGHAPPRTAVLIRPSTAVTRRRLPSRVVRPPRKAKETPRADERLYSMDLMRGVLMLLGIVLHSAQVFNPDRTWLVYSAEGSSIARDTVAVIHAFRMPAFFVIAGFFCLYTVKRHSARVLVATRLKRIGIPLLVTAASLNTAQALLLNAYGWKSDTLADYVTKGRWVYHLWFLIDLLVYFVLAYLLLVFARGALSRIGRVASALMRAVPMYVVLLGLPICNLAVLALGRLGVPLYSKPLGIFDTAGILGYLPYFAFGGLLLARPRVLERFVRVPPLATIAMILAGVVVPATGTPSESTLETIKVAYCGGLVTWASVCLCFAVFFRFFSRRSDVGLYVSKASYSVYLVHHLLVVAFGMALIRIGASPMPGLVGLIVVVTVASFAIHHWVIRPSRAMRWLLNGK